MELAQLKELITHLKQSGVLKFTRGDIALEFSAPNISMPITQPFISSGSPVGASSVFVPQPHMPNTQGQEGMSRDIPPDFQDDTMNIDKILNWSSPDQDGGEVPLPLTGDKPLDAA
jgi:hypothetical protein